MLSSPPINGLVLAGGSGSRMGKDKATLNIHGKPQWKHSKELLSGFLVKTWISLRPNHIPDKIPIDQIIFDKYKDLGPLAGILSAFEFDNEAAWLTLACDLPLVDKQLLKQLIQARDKDKIATAFWDKGKDFPEPLICIWEPKAYQLITKMVSAGIKSPGKVLIQGDASFIEPDFPKSLLNLNYPKDLIEVQKYIT